MPGDGGGVPGAHGDPAVLLLDAVPAPDQAAHQGDGQRLPGLRRLGTPRVPDRQRAAGRFVRRRRPALLRTLSQVPEQGLVLAAAAAGRPRGSRRQQTVQKRAPTHRVLLPRNGKQSRRQGLALQDGPLNPGPGHRRTIPQLRTGSRHPQPNRPHKPHARRLQRRQAGIANQTADQQQVSFFRRNGVPKALRLRGRRH